MMDDILAGRPFVLVDVYADWCEPCKWAEPVVTEALKSFDGKIALEKVNVDVHPDLARQFHIMSVPTLILFNDGTEVWRMRGFDTAPVLVKKFREFVKG